MKLTILLLFITVFSSFATQSYSQSTKLTIVRNNTTIESVLKEIEHQSEFRFFYNEKVNVEKRISINIRQKNVHELLDKIFQQTGIGYEIIGRQIALFPKEPPRKNILIQPQKKITIIKGKITGEYNETLPGVSVLLKGTTIGVMSDANGNYSIEIPANHIDKAILIFSYVSYTTQSISVNKQNTINVNLFPDRKKLNEVVVIAYGTQKKVAITGSVDAVSSKELMGSSSNNLSNALSGKLAGLSALQNGGGRPSNDQATIYLRGVSTLNGASPLILIDGVPRDNMNALDVNEVESVSILKDASATAVFGVRGANGVILIITKRGSEGKAKLGINFEQSYQSFTREPTRLHSVDYMKLRNLALANDGIVTSAYSDDVIAKYQNPLAGLNPSDPDYANQVKFREYIYPDHDYYHEFIRKYSPQTRVSINVTGGTKQLSYYVNTGYIHQGGNLNTLPKSALGYDPAEKMDRFTFRSNLDYKITKSLSAFLNLGTYIEVDNSPYTGAMYSNSESYMTNDILYQATNVLPLTPGPVTIAGYGVPAGEIVDPGYLDRSAYEVMNGRGYQKDYYSNLNSTLGATWDLSNAITSGLNIKGMISYDAYGGKTVQGAFGSKLYLAAVDYDTNTLSYTTKQDVGTPLSISSLGASTNYNINLQGSVNYSQKFGKHEIGGMVLAQRDYWEVSSGSSITLMPYNVIGLVGRATYNYDNRYFAEYDMGYNGSEQFTPQRRFGYFPAFSASWVLSNESFLKGSELLTNLKLRASYGKVGNDKMGSARFLYMDNNSLVSGNYQSLGKGKEVSFGLVGNPDLTWESARKKNAGIDFSIFKNLSGSFDYFIEHRSDILITRCSVPTFQGITPGNIPKANMGIVYNHGYEAVLNYTLPVNKDLSFSFRGNYSFARNIVKFADQVKRDSTFAVPYNNNGTYTTGYEVGQCFGYLINWKDKGGYWVSQDEIANSKLTYSFGTPRVGDFKYIDVNKDGVIDEKDQVPIGYSSTVPEILYGFTFGANYKAFDFSIFFQGVAHYSMYYSGNNVYEYIASGTFHDYQMNSWTQERYQNGSKITYPALSTHSTTNHIQNDFFIMNRAFTRLKNIEIGYTLPSNELKTLGISKLRVFVGGQNLYVWDHLRMGYLDPENNSPIGYPSTKMWNFGLNVTF